jgi:hypothetical protein
MPLRAFQSPRESAEIQSAVLRLIGQQLQSVFAAELDDSLTGQLADCLRRIEERENGSADPRP